MLQKEGLFVILLIFLDLESYVFSVLKTESWPGWPLEINKVMAVVCRTYVLHHILTPRTTKSLYHVKILIIIKPMQVNIRVLLLKSC